MLTLITAVLFLFGQERHASADPHNFNSWEEACATASSVVSEGDLIFLDIPNFLFRKVAEGSGSWTSHVGIVFKDPIGNWIVAESSVPLSKKVPLCKFLEKSSKYLFEVKRLNRPLESSEIAELLSKANAMLGIYYDLGFDFDSERLFCSKFVYLAYQSIGIKVGDIQTFRQLFEANPNLSLTFWKFWFFGSIPWDHRTVTPASQLNDSKFQTILKSS